MAKINLLPWRAERQRQRQKEFQLMMGGAAVIGLVLSGLWYLYNVNQISGQTERNTYLEAEIVKIDKEIEEIKTLNQKRDDLLARKTAVEKLQANRFQMVHLFDAIVRTLPEGVVLTSIKQEGEILTLDGRSQSNARVATYMRNLESSGWMTNPQVNVIEVGGAPANGTITSSENLMPYLFTLKVNLANPNAPRDPNAEPTPDPIPVQMSQQPAANVTPVVQNTVDKMTSTQPAPPAQPGAPATAPAPQPASAPQVAPNQTPGK